MRAAALSLLLLPAVLVSATSEAESPRGTKGAARAGADCYSCHPEAGVKGASFVHGPLNLDMCEVCHSTHDGKRKSVLLAQGNELCFSCHDADHFKGRVEHAPVKAGCIGCHSPHSGKTYSLLPTSATGLCRQCHSREAPKQARHDGDCTVCHEAHRSSRTDLLKPDRPRGSCRRDPGTKTASLMTVR